MLSRPNQKTSAGRARRRYTIAGGLVVIAMIAANVALVAEIRKFSSNARAAGLVFGAILGTNAALSIVFGTMLRLRRTALVAIFTIAALTEAVLWQAAAGGNRAWIAAVAVFSTLLLAALVVGLRAARQR